MAWKQTIVTVPAGGAFVTLAAQNPARTSLRFMNIGSGSMTVVTNDVVSPAIGLGMNYNGAANTGDQGGSDEFSLDAGQLAYFVGSTSGTSVAVWEYTPSRGIIPANSGL